MAQDDKMICTECGVEMNRHAEKIDYTETPDDSLAVDPQSGGTLEEAYTCPHCGKTVLRKAVSSSDR